MKTLTSVDLRPEQKIIVIQSYINTTVTGVSGFYEVVGSVDSIDQPANCEFQCILPSNVSWIVQQRDKALDISLPQAGGDTPAQSCQQQNPRKRRARKRVRQHFGLVRRSDRISLRNSRK